MGDTDKTLEWGTARTMMVFILITMVSLFFFGGIGMTFVKSTFGLASATGMRWLQLSISIGLFLMPPLFLAQHASSTPAAFLGLNTLPTYSSAPHARKNAKNLPPTYFTFLALILVAVGSFFAIDLLSHVNHMLPDYPWAETLIAQENQMTSTLTTLLSEMTLSVLAANVMVMVVIPAFGEELFFRGVLQKILHSNFGAPTAVILSALCFAFAHQQPLSMLPIFFMGLTFGFVRIWTGSLWAPILLHAINNSFALGSAYINNGVLPDTSVVAGSWISALGIIPCILGLLWLRNIYQSHTAWLR